MTGQYIDPEVCGASVRHAGIEMAIFTAQIIFTNNYQL